MKITFSFIPPDYFSGSLDYIWKIIISEIKKVGSWDTSSAHDSILRYIHCNIDNQHPSNPSRISTDKESKESSWSFSSFPSVLSLLHYCYWYDVPPECCLLLSSNTRGFVCCTTRVQSVVAFKQQRYYISCFTTRVLWTGCYRLIFVTLPKNYFDLFSIPSW